MYVSNAFASSMVQDGKFEIKTVSVQEAIQILSSNPFESAIGHADTANVFAEQLGIALKANRVNIALSVGQSLLVGQYTGPRLAEGATSLPEGASITWRLVTVIRALL